MSIGKESTLSNIATIQMSSFGDEGKKTCTSESSLHNSFFNIHHNQQWNQSDFMDSNGLIISLFSCFIDKILNPKKISSKMTCARHAINLTKNIITNSGKNSASGVLLSISAHSKCDHILWIFS